MIVSLLLHNSHQSQQQFQRLEQISLYLSPSARKVFECLDHFYTHFKGVVDVSQERVAQQTGYCRQTVNEAIMQLSSLGFIEKKRRYNKTSIYKIAAFFRINDHRARLAFIFKSFQKYLPLSLLSLLNNTISQESNPTIKESKYIKKILVSKSSSNRETRETRSKDEALNFYPKKKSKKQMEPFAMTPALERATKVLQLTKWGQLKLSILPEPVLLQSLDDLKRAKSLDNKFAYVISRSIKTCNDGQISINWQRWYDLKKMYQQPVDAKMTLVSVDKVPINHNKRADKSTRTVTVPAHKLYLAAVKMSDNERISFLQKEIVNCEQLIHNPPIYMDSINWMKKMLLDYVTELELLKGVDGGTR